MVGYTNAGYLSDPHNARSQTGYVFLHCGTDISWKSFKQILVATSTTIIYEDNMACVAQMDTGYIKSNITKHIAPKLFYPHQLKQNGEIDILQIKSCDNLADLFTKSLPTSIFQKLVCGIGMRRLRDLQDLGGESN